MGVLVCVCVCVRARNVCLCVYRICQGGGPREEVWRSVAQLFRMLMTLEGGSACVVKESESEGEGREVDVVLLLLQIMDGTGFIIVVKFEMEGLRRKSSTVAKSNRN